MISNPLILGQAINWCNPLNNGLIGFWLAPTTRASGYILPNLANSRSDMKIPITTALRWGPGQRKYSSLFSTGGANEQAAAILPIPAANNDHTICIKFKTLSHKTASPYIGALYNFSGNGSFVGRYGTGAAGNETNFYPVAADTTVLWTVSEIPLNEWHTVIIRNRPNSGSTLGDSAAWLNGGLKKDFTSINVRPSSLSLCLDSVSNRSNNCYIESVALYYRRFSPEEVVAWDREARIDYRGLLRRTRPYWTGINNGIEFDAASNSGYQAATNTYNWNHTCTGTDRFLAVDVSFLSVAGTTVTGITYNSVALTLIGQQASVSGACRVSSWGLVNPTSGTNSIVVTLSAATTSAGTAVSYNRVHQTTPTEAFNGAQATNVGAADATVTITTVADLSWVHAAIASDDTAITAGQTTRNNVTGALGSGANEDNGVALAASTAQAMTYTAVGALATWAIAGYAIRPTFASATTSTSITPVAMTGSGVTPTSSLVDSVSPVSSTASTVATTRTLTDSVSPRSMTASVVQPTPVLADSVTPIVMTASVVAVVFSYSTQPSPVVATLTVVVPTTLITTTIGAVSATMSAVTVVATSNPLIAAVSITSSVVAPTRLLNDSVSPVVATTTVVEVSISRNVNVDPVSTTLSVVGTTTLLTHTLTPVILTASVVGVVATAVADVAPPTVASTFNFDYSVQAEFNFDFMVQATFAFKYTIARTINFGS